MMDSWYSEDCQRKDPEGESKEEVWLHNEKRMDDQPPRQTVKAKERLLEQVNNRGKNFGILDILSNFYCYSLSGLKSQLANSTHAFG
jgi:hypothetical protein